MTPYCLVLLDFDGTLADTRPSVVFSMRHTFAELGGPLPGEEAIRATIGLPLARGIATLHPDLPAGEVSAWVARYRAIYAERAAPLTRLFSGAVETLHRLAEAGLALAVVSNKAQGPLELAVAEFGLAGLVAVAVGERPNGPAKPDPAFFESGVRPHFPDVAASQVLMVGDTEVDLAFARGIGADACFAAYGYGRPEACRALDPRHTIARIADLCAVLGLD
jgi:phosphoglycolate phosphatase